MIRRPLTIWFAGGAASAALLAACGGTSGGTPAASSTPTASPTPAAVVMTVTKTVAGKSEIVLTNASGLTLYYFTPDTSTKIACTGGCASVWPPLVMPSGTPTSATQLSGSLTVLVGANGRQVLYNGHPLYLYSNDTSPADTKGQGLFGKWFVSTPDLALAAGAAGTGRYGSGGGG